MNCCNHFEHVGTFVQVLCLEQIWFVYSKSLTGVEKIANVFHLLEGHFRAGRFVASREDEFDEKTQIEAVFQSFLHSFRTWSPCKAQSKTDLWNNQKNVDLIHRKILHILGETLNCLSDNTPEKVKLAVNEKNVNEKNASTFEKKIRLKVRTWA